MSQTPAQPLTDWVALGTLTLHASVFPSAKWKRYKQYLLHQAIMRIELTRVKHKDSIELHSKCCRYVNSSYHNDFFFVEQDQKKKSGFNNNGPGVG